MPETILLTILWAEILFLLFGTPVLLYQGLEWAERHKLKVKDKHHGNDTHNPSMK